MIRMIDSWSNSGDTYFEFRIGSGGACCVKRTSAGLVYVMECPGGNEVYSYIGGSDFPLRKATPEEKERLFEMVEEKI